MALHHALLHAAIVAAPLGAGMALFVPMRRELPWLVGLALALLGMALMFVFAVTIGAQCAYAYDAKLAARQWLPADEPATLRGAEMPCPCRCGFARDGQREHLVPDGESGARMDRG